MKILKTLLTTAEGLVSIDTIEYQGEYWLVPEWLEKRNREWQRPVRLIRVFGMQPTPNSPLGDFFVSQPIPIGLLEGRVPPGPEGAYVVIENPDIQVEYQNGLH